MSRKILPVAFLIVLLSPTDNRTCAQVIGAQDEDRILAQMQLENVKIEAQSIGQLFSHLSLVYNVPMGVEAALNDDESAIYHLNFKNVTLSDLLTAFVSDHREYSWQIKHGVVKVFPRESHRDAVLDKLLDLEISSFVVAKNTSCSDLAKSLVATPEGKRLLKDNKQSYRERNFTGFYFPQVGRQFTLRASNETLESILNRVIRESPSAKFWLVTMNGYDRTILLFLNARQEAVSRDSIK